MAQKRWRREQIPDAVREGQRDVLKLWSPHRSTMRFIQRFWPEKWDAISKCAMEYRFEADQQRPGFVKRIPLRCNQDPFCIYCARYKGLVRTMRAFNHFHRTTPKDMSPRFYHIVQTAPLTDDGQGWGLQASQDIRAFGRVVWSALKEEYGDGIGAVMSYQDFGEQGFAKRHAHMDLTLNGWRLEGDQATKVPAARLAGGGIDRWHERVVARACTLNVEARRGHVHFLSLRTGVPSYFKILRYQMRELVDFRKITYDRDGSQIGWKDYASNRVTKLPLGDFLLAMKEYETRLGRWKDKSGAKNLHRLYGIMAKGSIGQSQALMGGEDMPHKGNCPCTDCGDWIAVELTPEEERQIRPRRIRVAA